MVSDYQVRRLWKLMEAGKSLRQAALRTEMEEKTARKYGKAGLLPSQSRKAHRWRTRTDPFAEVWQEVEIQSERAPGLEAKTVFEELQRQSVRSRCRAVVRLLGTPLPQRSSP